MNNLRHIRFLCLVALSGCAAGPPFVVHETVGPHRPKPDPQGELIVYSATYVPAAEQAEYPIHSDYTLSDDTGRSLGEVRNHSGFGGSEPARVDLTPGRYKVKALAAGGGYVVIPVEIAAGLRTVLDLDGTAMPRSAATDDDVVKLPDGRVIGWRAKAE